MRRRNSVDWGTRNRVTAAILFLVFYGVLSALRDAGTLPMVGGLIELIARLE